MTGAILLVVFLLVVIPVGVIVSGAIVAAILGWSLKDTAEAAHEGSELVELS